MNYHVSALPANYKLDFKSAEFKPDDMRKLFEAGEEWAKNGAPWRTTPPGLEPGETPFQRKGTTLQVVPMPQDCSPIR
jgi:hypothetical protein